MSKYNSAVVIARLLSTEGFTDRLANAVEKYWLKNTGLSKRQQHQIKRLDVELSKMAADLSEGEKRVLGRFIALHKKMSFDTGLRIGMTLAAHKNVQDVEEATGRV